MHQSPYRQYLGASCECCGFIPEHPVQMDVDHRDGDHENNEASNLQTLCANCHRLKTMLERDEIGPQISWGPISAKLKLRVVGRGAA